MNGIFSQNSQSVMALAPDADRWNGDPATDIINTKNYGHVTFYIMEGAGGTGTTVLTVEECDDVSASNSTAIAFNYRVTAAGGGDTFGALTAATAAGYTTIAGAQKQIIIEIDAAELSDGFPFVRIQTTEAVDSPCDAAIIAICTKPRYSQAIMPTAIV